MEKYFFDLVGQDQSQYDYRGRVFSGPEKAVRLAEVIALDLEMRGEGEWSGWRLKMRSAHCEESFSVPVLMLGLWLCGNCGPARGVSSPRAKLSRQADQSRSAV